MTIIDFYTELSKMLEKARSGKISEKNGLQRLDEMIAEATQNGLEIDISRDIFKFENLVKFDDENSYEEDENSYEDDESLNETETNNDSSYDN